MSTEIKFNKSAKEYVPKNQRQQITQNTCVKESIILENKENNEVKVDIKFNLQAKEYVPKKNDEFKIGGLSDNDDDEDQNKINKIDDDDDAFFQELNIDEFFEDDESDEDNWFTKYKECTCCKGYIYKCKGEVCQSLGVCYCKAHEDNDI